MNLIYPKPRTPAWCTLWSAAELGMHKGDIILHQGKALLRDVTCRRLERGQLRLLDIHTVFRGNDEQDYYCS